MIFSTDRRWKIVEINDHPVALAEGARLASNSRCDDLFLKDPFLEIARVLGRHSARVALLLPKYFRIIEKAGSRTRVEAVNAVAYDDQRIGLTISDFNGVAEACRRSGIDVEICDIARVSVHDQCVVVDERWEFGAIVRRHSQFPPVSVRSFCVNDLRQRIICRDKYQMYWSIVARCGADCTVPTFLFDTSERTMEFIRRSMANDVYLMLKPRLGSASQGIRRVKARDAWHELRLHDGSEWTICQPWLRPAAMQCRGRPYYFDVRVYVLDGRVISGFARRAAGPCIGPIEDSPLSWLTTTGPTVPLRYASRAETGHPQNAGIEFTCDEVERMFAVAIEGVSAADDAALLLDHEAAFQRICATEAAPDRERARFVDVRVM